MTRQLLRLLAVTVLVAAAPGWLAAQDPATLTGRVTNEVGEPLRAVTISVPALALGTLTNEEGRYLLIIPAARVAGQTVILEARLLGYRTGSAEVTLEPGTIVRDFRLATDPLRLEQIVVTGVGTAERRDRLAMTISSVDAQQVVESRETNIVSALAGKAPNVEVTTSAGDPGSGAYIRIRGANTVFGGTQPLFIVDGMIMNNNSHYPIQEYSFVLAGTPYANRGIDLNPNDIESVEILKGPAAAALYGSQAASGVVVISTKSGRPGENRFTFKSSFSRDEVTQMPGLQRRFGQGLIGDYWGAPGATIPSVVTWGPELPPGTPTYDHAYNVFQNGWKLENDMTWSGGSERTTYYFSLGRVDHQGTIRGNSDFQRTTARLKGSHAFADNFRLSGNLSYANTGSNMIQNGSNLSGLLLAALRTPPEFNNCRPDANPCYTHPETGLHYSYRVPNPTALVAGRGYDNPLWVANELPNEVDVSRTIATVDAVYDPMPWLNLSYSAGVDYASDEQIRVWPKSSSEDPQGRVIRANFMDRILTSNLVATATRTLTPDLGGSLTLGWQVGQEDFRRYQVLGQNLIFGTELLDFTVTRIPDEYRSRVRTDGYFGQATVDLFDQLFLSGGLRYDGASTFGGDKRFWYPRASAAWDFGRQEVFSRNVPQLDFGKLRLAWGRSGKQPPAYSNVTAYQTTVFGDGWLTSGLESIYLGQEGVVTQFVMGNDAIKPEQTTGFDAGVDLAFFGGRTALSVTYYNEKSEDVILTRPLPPTTGFASTFDNAATIRNRGWEVTAGVRPIETRRFSLDFDAQWSRNRSCVSDLKDAESIHLGGFFGSRVVLMEPDPDTGQCHPYGVIFGFDWVRFGRGVTIGGTNIDQAYPDAPAGAIYIAADGFPREDPQERVLGDTNPKWLGSFRTTLTFFNNLRVSGLLDVKYGGDMWNGTKGALFYFGTHEETLPFHGNGTDVVFGQDFMGDTPVAGPGAGTRVNLNQSSWSLGGLGNGFTGPASQFVEDAGFVKLRDITVSYTVTQDWVRRFGFNSMDVALSGRNLKTWTDYTGIDPESNLIGQLAARGLDYFNNPQTRSFVITVTMHR